MAFKLEQFIVSPKEGGFLLTVEGRRDDDTFIHDEYIIPTYPKLLKAFKEEMKEYNKPRAKKEA